jgi:hypothetical protein
MSRYNMNGLSDGFLTGLKIGESIKESKVQDRLSGFKGKYASYQAEKDADIKADETATGLMQKYQIDPSSAAYYNIYEEARRGASLSSIEKLIMDNKKGWSDLEAKTDAAGIPDVVTPDTVDQTNAALTDASESLEVDAPQDAVVTTDEQMADLDVDGTSGATTLSDTLPAQMVMSESSNNANASFTDSKGRTFAGELGMGQQRLDDFKAATGVAYTPADMATLTEAQKKELSDWHFGDIESWLDSSGVSEYVGQDVVVNGETIQITADGIAGMAHLGGKTGAKTFLESGGQSNPGDELSTKLSDYLAKFQGGSGATQTTPVDNTPPQGSLTEAVQKDQQGDTEGGIFGWFKARYETGIENSILQKTGLANIDQFNAIMASGTGKDGYTPIRRGTGEMLPIKLVDKDGRGKTGFVDAIFDSGQPIPELGGKSAVEIDANGSAEERASLIAYTEKLWENETYVDRSATKTSSAIILDAFTKSDPQYLDASATMIRLAGLGRDLTDSEIKERTNASSIIQARIKSLDDEKDVTLKASYLDTVYQSPAWESLERVIEKYDGRDRSSLSSDELAELEAAQDSTRTMLASAELAWKSATSISTDGKNSYSGSNFNADSIEYERIANKKAEGGTLTPTEQKMLETFPLTRAAYQTATAKPSDDDPVETVVSYTNASGQVVTANFFQTKGADGALVYTGADGATLDTGTILQVSTTEADKQQSADLARVSSSTIVPLRESYSAVVDLGSKAKSLTAKVAQYESILTATGSLNSVGNSFFTEIQTFVEFLGGEELRKMTSAQLTEAVEGFNAKSESGGFDKNASLVYKQFQADMVRFVFAVGRAEKQAGNGFSNQDYRVLKNSVQAGNSFQSFTTTLKSLVSKHWETHDVLVMSAAREPEIMRLLSRARAVPKNDTMSPTFLTNAERFSEGSVANGTAAQSTVDAYNWSNTETGRILIAKIGQKNNTDIFFGQGSLPDEIQKQIKSEIADMESQGWTEWYVQLVPRPDGTSETEVIGVSR